MKGGKRDSERVKERGREERGRGRAPTIHMDGLQAVVVVTVKVSGCQHRLTCLPATSGDMHRHSWFLAQRTLITSGSV